MLQSRSSSRSGVMFFATDREIDVKTLLKMVQWSR